MKPGGYLINCIHPGLMDEAALLSALENGILAGAALDTWDAASRPKFQGAASTSQRIEYPAIKCKQSLEGQINTAIQIVSDLLAALRGEDFRNIVNLPFNDQIALSDRQALYRSGCQIRQAARAVGRRLDQAHRSGITRRWAT